MGQTADTLTTRDAIRHATANDIVDRCNLAAVAMEGGPLDGLQVVSMGTLRDQVTAHLLVDLGPPSDKTAEVVTPAQIFTSAICPECHLPVEITVNLRPRLVVENGQTEISVKASSKARAHLHGQTSLSEDGQVGMDVAIDDHRLRILGAVYDLEVEHDEEGTEPGPIPTLDVIAQRLELANESDRGDLEESLYAYSQLEDPLLEVKSAKGEPVTYGLTDAGVDLVDAARKSGDAGDDDQDDDDDDADDDGELVPA